MPRQSKLEKDTQNTLTTLHEALKNAEEKTAATAQPRSKEDSEETTSVRAEALYETLKITSPVIFRRKDNEYCPGIVVAKTTKRKTETEYENLVHLVAWSISAPDKTLSAKATVGSGVGQCLPA